MCVCVCLFVCLFVCGVVLDNYPIVALIVAFDQDDCHIGIK